MINAALCVTLWPELWKGDNLIVKFRPYSLYFMKRKFLYQVFISSAALIDCKYVASIQSLEKKWETKLHNENSRN